MSFLVNPEDAVPKIPLWSYGITTVPERKDTTFPTTCASLTSSGFPNPHIFIDNHPRLLTYGRWVTAMWELFIRNPVCDRYALFQDDFVCCRNLRTYLDRTLFPHDKSHSSNQCYYNLLTQLQGEMYVGGKPVGWIEAPSLSDPPHLQYGKGAVALVFNREGVMTLLSSRHLVERVITADIRRKNRNVDGAVVTAMNYAGWREYIHNPSLVGHIGYNSITSPGHTYPSTHLFPGEQKDALSFIKE